MRVSPERLAELELEPEAMTQTERLGLMLDVLDEVRELRAEVERLLEARSPDA